MGWVPKWCSCAIQYLFCLPWMDLKSLLEKLWWEISKCDEWVMEEYWGLDKNETLSLPFGQPALQFYLPKAILNWPKVQSMVTWAMKIFNHACPSGKWQIRSTCPRLLNTVYVEPTLQAESLPLKGRVGGEGDSASRFDTLRSATHPEKRMSQTGFEPVWAVRR